MRESTLQAELTSCEFNSPPCTDGESVWGSRLGAEVPRRGLSQGEHGGGGGAAGSHGLKAPVVMPIMASPHLAK